MRSFFVRCTALPAIAALAACASSAAKEDAPPPTAGETREPIVSPTSPFRYDATSTALPDLGVHGALAAALGTATDSGSVHEGTFSNGRDTNRAGQTDPATWYPIAAGKDFAQFESSPAFTDDLSAAVGSAGGTLGKLTDLGPLAWALSAFPLPLQVTPHAPADAFYGWSPVQARWLRSQYVTTSTSGAMTKEIYATPSVAAEIRERGARLYCAARRAQVEQGKNPHSVSMGRQVALPLSILGKKVDIGVVEATVALDGPQAFTGNGAPDGAQAFEIPFVVGTSITPIDGIGLPGFGELRHPMVLVTGDSEVASAVAPQWIHNGDVLRCTMFGCSMSPTYVYDAPKDYQTVTHADAARGRSEGLDVKVPPTPIFTLGTVTLYLSGTGNVTVGNGGPATPANDRLLSSVPTGWPSSARANAASASPFGTSWAYDEGAWQPNGFSVDAPVSGTMTFLLPGTADTQQVAATDPMILRALHDDDHHLASTTSVSLGAAATVSLGFNLGIAEFTVNGTAGLDLTFAHQTDVRDGELTIASTAPPGFGGYPSYPLTALTVVPQTSTNATFNLTVTVRIYVDLPGPFDIDETVTVVDASKGKTWTNGAWPEQNRELLATGNASFSSDPTNKPWAVSHLPNAPSADMSTVPTFNSFDTDVPTCLADTTPSGRAPDPCPPTATGSAPSGNLCVFSGSQLGDTRIGYGAPSAWVGACMTGDYASHAASILPTGTPEQQACIANVLAYVCSPQSMEQDWHGQHGVSHVIDTVTSSSTTFSNLVVQCTSAFSPTSSVETFNRIFEFGVCDANAKMLDPGDVVTMTGTPDTTPNPVGSGSCH